MDTGDRPNLFNTVGGGGGDAVLFWVDATFAGNLLPWFRDLLSKLRIGALSEDELCGRG